MVIRCRNSFVLRAVSVAYAAGHAGQHEPRGGTPRQTMTSNKEPHEKVASFSDAVGNFHSRTSLHIEDL